MAFEKVMGVSDLSPGNMKKVSINGTDILVVNLSGTFYALTNTCTHMGGSLADGRLEGSTIRCPRHGAGFDVQTGKNIIQPKIMFIKGHAGNLKTYPVKIEQNDVLVDIG